MMLAENKQHCTVAPSLLFGLLPKRAWLRHASEPLYRWRDIAD